MLFFIFAIRINAQIYGPFEFVYTDWLDYYPEGVDEIRIESQDRYKWLIDGEESEEYYDYLEGYTRIDESKKTFYRVINNDYIVLDSSGRLVTDLNECRKAFCVVVNLKPYIVNEEEEPEPEEPTPSNPPEEEFINPDTYDPIYTYIISLILCIFVLFIINKRKINLVMSKC